MYLKTIQTNCCNKCEVGFLGKRKDVWKLWSSILKIDEWEENDMHAFPMEHMK